MYQQELFEDFGPPEKPEPTNGEEKTVEKKAEATKAIPPPVSKPTEGGEEQSMADDPEPPFDIYYNSARREYLIQKPDGRWHAQTLAQLKMRLKMAGISGKDDQDRIILDTQDYRDVQYAAPLAGKQAGYHEENGIRFVVTDSPKLIEPVAGQWSNLKKIFEGLLVNGEPDVGSAQWHTFLGWLKTSVAALRSGHYQQAQVLALAGKPDCGKSFVQHLLTEMLGGRDANGFEYLSGGDSFNAELFESEHIVLEDENMGKRQSDRAKLAKALKRFSSSTWTQRCRGMRKNGINLRPFWRVSITLNDGQDDLLVLPPLDDSIEDKLILLRGSKFDFPEPFDTSEEKAKFRQTLISEIPAFLHWLLNEYKIPEDHRDQRFGVKAWHHPVLHRDVELLSNESRLLALIDQVAWKDTGSETWEGSAAELYQLLTEDRATKSEARCLVSGGQATGNLLGKLAKKFPDRVEGKRTEKKRSWVIQRPKA